MNTKAPNPDGKNQVTSDSEIVTGEILKHRNLGRFLEQTQYFQRRVTIPLDAPRKQVRARVRDSGFISYRQIWC